MGKLLYEQFVAETVKIGTALPWEHLPRIAKDAWNNVWLTSKQVCKLAIEELAFKNELVTLNQIQDELDKIK